MTVLCEVSRPDSAENSSHILETTITITGMSHDISAIVEVGVDAIGVGGGELGQGLLPTGDLGALDEAGFGSSVVGLLAFVLVSLVGSVVLDVADRQPQQLGGGFVGREVASVLGDLAQLVVQRLDGVGGVDHPAQGRRESQEWDESFPGPLPGRCRLGVLGSQVAH